MTPRGAEMSLTSLFSTFDTRQEAIDFADYMFDRYGCSIWVYECGDPDMGPVEWHAGLIQWSESECVYSRAAVEPITQDMFEATA